MTGLLAELQAWWHQLPLGPHARAAVRALVVGVALLALVASIERVYRASPAYRSRAFLHDVFYWFYYRIGIHYTVFAFAFGMLAASLPADRPQLLAGLPFPVQALLYLAIVDLCTYWIHRVQHAVPWLWAFHSVHHSQTDLNFATSQRVHPLDHLFQDLLLFVPLFALGFDEGAWLPLYVAGELTLALQHSRVPWTYGPLYRVIVSPVFHQCHHATDPAYHDRNFAGMFSLWDYVFGTAAPRPRTPPQQFGIDGLRHATLLDTLIEPFKRLAGRRGAAAVDAPEALRVRD